MNIFQQPKLSSVEALLKSNDLPTSDLSKLEPSCFFGCGDEDDPSGAIGVELIGEHGLLRSLVVSDKVRGQGCGQALVSRLEKFTLERGVKTLYLLTETAEVFFSRLDYVIVDRESVPEEIKLTNEFSSLCPDDAIVMRKVLSQSHA